MGYTAAGGVKGLGAITPAVAFTPDLNKILQLLARTANFLGPLSEAARDAVTGDALFPGLLVFNTDAPIALEVWTGAAWKPVWGDDTGWVTTGVSITPATNWTVSSYRLRRIRNHVLGVVALAYSGSTVTPSSGNFTPDVDVLTMPAGWRNGEGRTRPVNIQQAAARQYYGRAVSGSSGVVRITHGHFVEQTIDATNYEVHLDYLTD